MAIQNFIPTIWSETLLNKLDKKYIVASNCNRDFDADVKEMGASVKVCGVGDIVVNNYKKNTDMGAPQALTDTCEEIMIDQAKYFNFQIDDIDKAQCSPKLMGAAMNVAAEALAKDADAYICSLYSMSGNSIMINNITVDNILDTIIQARTMLYEKNVSDSADVVLEVSPAVAEIILKAKLNTVSDNMDLLEHGFIGCVAGCKVFVTNSIVKDVNNAEGITTYQCVMRTKRSIAFIEQISEIQAYRPEQRFADAVKGLYLYGAGIVYYDEMVYLELGVKK